MGLDLYARIEPYLDFEEEIYSLHKEFLKFIMVNDLDNIIDIGCGQGYFLNNLSCSSFFIIRIKFYIMILPVQNNSALLKP